MKIRLASDLHTEFFDEDQNEMDALADIAIPPMDDDKVTVLLLAGDIGSMKCPENIKMFMNAVAPRFERLIYIAGNHEFYFGNLQTTPGYIKEIVSAHENVSFTTMGIFPIGDRNILAATLWTDFEGGDPISMNEARYRMNDYRLIRNGNYVAQPENMLKMHQAYVESLRVMREGDIVVTHHMPSFQCVPEEYKHERVNGAYASDLEALILEKKPALWCCGHTHTAFDKMIGNTRVVINPRGYGNQHKTNGYNPYLAIEI